MICAITKAIRRNTLHHKILRSYRRSFVQGSACHPIIAGYWMPRKLRDCKIIRVCSPFKRPVIAGSAPHSSASAGSNPSHPPAHFPEWHPSGIDTSPQALCPVADFPALFVTNFSCLLIDFIIYICLCFQISQNIRIGYRYKYKDKDPRNQSIYNAKYSLTPALQRQEKENKQHNDQYYVHFVPFSLFQSDHICMSIFHENISARCILWYYFIYACAKFVCKLFDPLQGV